MQPPLFVLPLTDAEHEAVEQGVRSANASTRRRSQILAASTRGEHVSRLARSLSGNEQTVRNAIPAFQAGVAALTKRSCRVHTDPAALTPTRLRSCAPSCTVARATSACGRSPWRPRKRPSRV